MLRVVVFVWLGTFAASAWAQEDVTNAPPPAATTARPGEPETVGEPKLEGQTQQILDKAGGWRIGRIIVEPLASGVATVVAALGMFALTNAVCSDSGCYFALGLLGDVGLMFVIAGTTYGVGRAMGGLGGFWYPFLGALISLSAVWAADPEVKPVGLIMAPLAAVFLFEMESWFKENGLRNGVLTPRDVAIAPVPIFGPDRRPVGAGLSLAARF